MFDVCMYDRKQCMPFFFCAVIQMSSLMQMQNTTKRKNYNIDKNLVGVCCRRNYAPFLPYEAWPLSLNSSQLVKQQHQQSFDV